ncbi:MAG: rhodanese-like domain-containing protein [Nostocoides sp.]
MTNYAGDVSPADAYAALQHDPTAVLIDVRTKPEWAYVGVPDLDILGKPVHLIEWSGYPDGAHNEGFIAELAEAGVGQDAPLYFICRSGVRSAAAAAAATAAGFGPAYNVIGGFEGDLDPAGHRGVGGWKSAGLPWRQG